MKTRIILSAIAGALLALAIPMPARSASPPPFVDCECHGWNAGFVTGAGNVWVHNIGPGLCWYETTGDDTDGACTDMPACEPEEEASCSFSGSARVCCPSVTGAPICGSGYSWGPLESACTADEPTSPPDQEYTGPDGNVHVSWDITCAGCAGISGG